jgi:hypothetical protein
MERMPMPWYVHLFFSSLRVHLERLSTIRGINHTTTNLSVNITQYTASAKTSSLEQTARALATLSDVFKRDPKLAVILRAPTLTVGDKSQIAQELLRVAGGPGKDGILQNFLNTLAENNRLSVLEGVCEKFTMLMGAHRGEIELIITSAQVYIPPPNLFM